MKFTTRTIDNHTFQSEVFSSREIAEAAIKANGCIDATVSHVSASYASSLGYPCGGFAILDAWGKPYELHTVVA